MKRATPHLVVFGCGYVGSVVAREAKSRGLRVTALTRNEAKALVLRESGIDTVVADLASTTWHRHIDAAQFVLNAVSSGGGGADGYRRSYVDGMKSIAAWAARGTPVDTIVYTSSTAVYPQGGGAVIDETADTNHSDERPRLLVEAETNLQAQSTAWQRWFVLRLAGIYGPGRTHLVEQVRSGEVAGIATHHLNLIHRDDIAAALWACFTAAPSISSGIFNVADDGRATRGEIVSWIAAQLGLAPPRFTNQPAGQRQAVTPDRIIGNAKIKALLGWRPRYSTFREGYANLLSR